MREVAYNLNITQDIAKRLESGELSAPDIISIVASMEISLYARETLIDQLTKELNLKNAVIQKKNDTLYALTQAGWKTGLRMNEYEENDEFFGSR